MRKISKRKKVFGIALLFGGLVGNFSAVGVSEGQELHLLNRDIVLLDCVENANAFVVKNVSSTRDVGISQGMDCAASIQKLFATGFVLGQGTGGVTSGEPTSLNHFLMLFVFNSNSLIEQRNPIPLLNPSQDCVLDQNFRECPPKVERHEPLGPILNTHEPLSPILQRRKP